MALVGASVGSAHQSANVTYIGDRTKMRTRTINGVRTEFYWGEITVTVTGDFGKDLSLMSFQGSYMGGEKVFLYSEVCDVGWGGYDTVDATGGRYNNPLLNDDSDLYDELYEYVYAPTAMSNESSHAAAQ
jgi:hypothetical protein